MVAPRGSCPPLAFVAVVAYLALFGAMSWPAQGGGWTQSAHYALVRALADGTPRIDAYESETGDLSYVDGHYYSVKAPGLALTVLPAYAALDAAGLWPTGAEGALWLVALLGAAVPALALCILVARVADSLEPGSGLAVGLTLGLGTLVLPFATMAFSHVWSALLAFACFAVLLHERRGPGRLWLVGIAGVLAGLGVVFEYPTAFAGAILGVLAIARPGWPGRGLAYAGGALAGVVPLLAYNQWAFGSPFTLSYANAITEKGESGHDIVGAHAHGVFGITQPSLRTLADLLVTDRGLLLTTPVVAAGVAGLVLLIRANRHRAAAWTSLAIAVAFPVYNSGVTTTFGGAFGGDSPGPRYLVTALPFALVALGVAYRRASAATLALAAVSAAFMVAATASGPLIGEEEMWIWWDSLRYDKLTHTVAWLLGWERAGFAPALPFFASVAVVVAIAARSFVALRRPRADEASGAVAAIAAWALVSVAVPPLLAEDEPLRAGALALALLAAGVLLAVAGQRPGAGRPPHPRPR